MLQVADFGFEEKKIVANFMLLYFCFGCLFQRIMTYVLGVFTRKLEIDEVMRMLLTVLVHGGWNGARFAFRVI